MASAKELTGGLGDVNPQTLVVDLAQTATDQLQTIRITIPRPRFLPPKGKTIVLEVLRIHVDKGVPFFSVVSTQQEVNFEVSTSSNFGIAEPDVLAHFAWIQRLLVGTTSAIWNEIQYQDRDMSDGAGHGFLVATDEFNFRLLSINTLSQNRVVCRILYRYKSVDITEFLGIVQSQI